MTVPPGSLGEMKHARSYSHDDRHGTSFKPFLCSTRWIEYHTRNAGSGPASRR